MWLQRGLPCDTTRPLLYFIVESLKPCSPKTERVGSKHVGLGGRVESVPWRAAGPTTEFPEFPWCDSDTPTSVSWIYILPFSFLKKICCLGTCYIDQVALQLKEIPLPLSRRCYDYRAVPPYPVCLVFLRQVLRLHRTALDSPRSWCWP